MAELGAYYITVMPSMKGFSSAVNKQLKGLGTQGGKQYESGFMSVLKGSAIGTVLGNLATRAGSAIAGGLQTGIGRIDTIQNFPKVMQSLGYEAGDADKSIRLIMDHLDGLPTATQDVVTLTQAIADSTGSLDLATRASLGFNDMMLANGASTAEITQAQGVFNRVLGKGSATVAQWQSLQSVMPAQLAAVARELLGQSGSVEELRDKLNDGTISWDSFLEAIVRLDENDYLGATGQKIASFAEQARANSVGIGTAMANVQNRIGQGWASILEAIGREDISAAINNASYGVRDAMRGIADTITEFKDRLGETKVFQNLQTIMQGLSDHFGSLGDAISGRVSAALPVLADLIDKALQWLVDHGPQISEFVGAIEEKFGALADAIGGALATALPVASELVSGVLQWVLDHGELVATLLAGIASGYAAFGTAQTAWNIVTGLPIVFGNLAEVLPMVTSIGDIPAALSLVAEAGGPATGAIGGLSGALSFLAANPVVLVVAAIGAIVGALAWWVTQTEAGQKAWDNLCKGVADLAEGLRNDIKGAFDRIKQNLEDNAVQWEQFKTNLATWNEEMRQKISQKWEDIKTAVSDKARSLRDDVANYWKESAEKTATWNENMRQKALQKWEDIKTAVGDKARSVKESISSYWSEAASQVGTWGENMRQKALDKWESIKNGIADKIEAARKKVSDILDKIKGLFNFSWSLPAPKLPHITWHWTDIGGIISLPEFDGISWYGKGGVFDTATLIGIGERGREAALPLNDQTYGEIADGIYGRMGKYAPTEGGITIDKLADTIIIRETADVDEVMDRINTITRRERGAQLWASAQR